MKKVTKRQQALALAAVAAWMGKHGMGDENGSPAPTGRDAAYRGLGPELVSDWDWPGEPTPTILLEGGPYDWAIVIGDDPTFRAAIDAAGIWSEPYAGYALCLYRES